MQLGHGRPDQPQHGFEVVAVQAGGGEFGGGGRADGVVDALRVSDSPSAALTDVLVMPVFPHSCDLDSVGPAANAGVGATGCGGL